MTTKSASADGHQDSNQQRFDWRSYERGAVLAELEELGVGLGLTASANVRIFGVLSKAKRQIDLLVEPRWAEEYQGRVIVDAKRYSRPLDVKDVEAFEGMMRDCRAEHGVLICANGWSKAAARRAGDRITLRCYSVDDASGHSDSAGIADCEACYRDQPDPQLRGFVMWNGQLPLVINRLFAIVWTGLCDVCGKSQVWCWDCGSIFSVEDDEPHTCGCERVWTSVSVPTTEDADDLGFAARLLLVQFDNDLLAVDRRSL